MSEWADIQPLRRWLGTQDVPVQVLLACREHADVHAWRAGGAGGDQVIFVLSGCLSDVPTAGLLELLAAGARSVTALLDGCRAPVPSAESVARADRIASALGRAHQVRPATAPPDVEDTRPARRHGRWARIVHGEALIPLLDANAMPVSRRALVGAPTRRDDTGRDGLPSARLLKVVSELLGDAPVPVELEELSAPAARLTAPSCCGSAVCVRVCPTDALTLRVTELSGAGDGLEAVDQLVLDVDPSLCIDCGECIRLCPEQAMVRTGTSSWRDALSGSVQTVRVALSKRCSRCGAVHRGSGSRCQVCEFRTAQPFGSQLPAGFTRPGRD